MHAIKMVRYLIITWFAIFGTSVLHAQDSIKTLSAQQVIRIVKQYHPVARQASLLIEKAKAEITIARGGFDPVFYNTLSQKTFDGIAYYKYNQQQLSIPTWFGIEVYTGLETLNGSRLNPEETGGETSYFGLSVPFAKNLLMDKRRATLQTAKIFRQASEIERKNTLNNLLLDAMKSYWYWIQYYQVYKIIDNAVLVNEKRTEMVKTGVRLGDRPAIDSTEALTQLQSFLVMREGAWMQFQNAGLELSQFLWTVNDTPAMLPTDVIPADEPSLQNITNAGFPVLSELLDAALNNHPELLLYNFKLNALDIEKKLKFQQLLPALNFRYNQLGKGYDILKTMSGPLFENNFQYGFSFGIPLRLSEGRGEYRKAKLKIAETKLDQNLKRLQIELKVKSHFNELTAVKKQLAVQELAYQNYVRLQRAEEIRFQIGESSLFLINARENKTLEALQKLQEMRTKYLVTLNALQWAAGILIQ
jgi:outer membrane protein TolC